METFEDIFTKYELIGLLLGCFASSSILPLPSEPLIMIIVKFQPAIYVFIFALIGSVGGAMLNYVIGIKGIKWIVKRESEKEKKLEMWFSKYGIFVLLAVPWIPFVGDLLTIVAGALKMDLKKFIFWITISKAIKISVVIYVAMTGMKFFGI
ncbi:MAG: YqaA family protein [Candidatus Altarchaeum sp.]|nr:YqaA family protein [Candidatus Altarchaeum sp.]